LACELELLGRVGVHLDERCCELRIPELDYRASFDQVRTKLANEIRLDDEQHHLALAQRLYAEDSDVQIPRLFAEHCTPRVTAMERIFGVKITDHDLNSDAAKRRLANRTVRALISRPLFAAGDAAIFHCDPHAGNLMHARDGRLAILDWSLITRLSESERVTLTELILAAITIDGRRLGELIAQLAARGSVDRTALDAVVCAWLQRYRSGQFPGLTWLTGLLDDAAQTARLHVSAELMLLRKALHTLDGVVAELTSDPFMLDEALILDYLTQFSSERATRWTALLGSREFARRMWNRDLLVLACTWPLVA
jgi:ubiquinone biosynthesis protein